MNHLQANAGLLDGIALGKVIAESGRRFPQRKPEHLALFFLQIQKECVLFVRLGLHPISLGDKRVAQYVIQVQVRVQQVAHGQVVCGDIVR